MSNKIQVMADFNQLGLIASFYQSVNVVEMDNLCLAMILFTLMAGV